jgi:hypothetical protein
MLRIKLFGLFIAFAGLALVRPRKCLELLEAADAGVQAAHHEKLAAEIRERQRAGLLQDERFAERRKWTFAQWWQHVGAWENTEGQVCFGTPMAVRAMLIQYGEALLALERSK